MCLFYIQVLFTLKSVLQTAKSALENSHFCRWFTNFFVVFSRVAKNIAASCKNAVDNKDETCYYIYVAYDGNKMNKVCGSGGTADALASGASGGNPVEVQILSTAPRKLQPGSYPGLFSCLRKFVIYGKM